ncbi:hypothetical protein ACUNWD_02455 [Sunxiuqinia sp. A32]|uniref:hypothetical protein n=1 Tax=Sunxiuqinia sp. A32 TaxID=3461496 RepID=UPI0040462657
MEKINSTCFVCGKEVDPKTTSKNLMVNLPICKECKGSDKEKVKVDELLEGMADGFVCGCI